MELEGVGSSKSGIDVVHSVKKMVIAVTAGFVFVYLLLIVYVYIRQDSMLYYPVRELEATPRTIGLDYEEVTVRTRDNVDISAWYIPVDNAQGVVLFCHGNAGNISHRLDSIRIFHSLNLAVFIFDYRGYGKSAGSPNEEGTYQDAEAAWDYLVTKLHMKPERIILFGRSLGSAVAAELALRRKAGVLIMESAFTSVPALGARLYPFLPVRLISKYHYASIGKVSRISIPKLFIHSPDDEVVPFDHGEQLFRSAEKSKEFLTIRGGHNEGFLISGQHYVEGLRKFVSQYIKK